MPRLSQDQINEIEQEMADLVDENIELRKDNAALLAQLQREKATPQD